MFALALTLCTFASCNNYVIATDTEWKTEAPCNESLYVESDLMAKAWGHNPRLVSAYLKRFNVKEDVQTLVDYDYTCENIKDDDIP
jgi:hypothetical protein